MNKMSQRFIFCFLALLSVQCFVKCEITILPDSLYFNLSTTSRVDLFIAQNQRQFMAVIKDYEQQLSNFKALYTERVQVLNYNEEFVATKFEELENKLNPLELLDDIADHCVQKYRSKVPVFTTIKTNFANCLQKANAAYQPVAAAPEGTMNGLRNYYASTHANAMKNCKTNHIKSERNYTTCALTTIKTTTSVTNTNFNTFNNQMRAASCSTELRIREAFDCYSGVISSSLYAISEVTTLVDNCIAGHEFCPSCGDDTDIVKGRCPYQMSWHLAETDLTTEKITNPFKGISPTSPCLQINFIKRSVELV